jgi:hypothetical protein
MFFCHDSSQSNADQHTLLRIQPPYPHVLARPFTPRIQKRRRQRTRLRPTMTLHAVRRSQSVCPTFRNSAHTRPSGSCPRAPAVARVAPGNSSLAMYGFRGHLCGRVNSAHLRCFPPRILWRYALSITLLGSRSAKLIGCAWIGISPSLLLFLVVLYWCATATKRPQFVGHRAYRRCSGACVMCSVDHRAYL